MDVHTSPVPHVAENHAASVEADIARIIMLQQANRQRIGQTTAAERVAKLKRLRAALFEHRQAIRDALHADFRKPPEEVDLTEILPVSLEIGYTIKHLKRWMKPKRVGTPLILFGTRSEIRYEPKGVGLIISPWNYPVELTLTPLVGAIAAGCCAIIKPSEYTPHTSRLLSKILSSLFEEDEVAVFEGDYTVSQALLRHPFDHIFFTGSPAVGQIVMRAAAEHLSSVTLELGGKSPTIVDETADIDDAAQKIAFGKFANNGQTCIAPDYVYVHERVHDGFVNALRKHIQGFYGDDAAARSATPDYARIVSDKHHRRVRHLYQEALDRGAQAVTGGTSEDAERFIDPTVLTEVPPDTRLMQEEIFGPVLPILRFKTLDEAIETINSKPKPLALYVFSSSNAAIEHVLRNTSAGGTCINDTLLHFLHPDLPFGGVNTSGIGQGHGYYGFLAFSNERPVLRQKLKNGPFKKFYPPYTRTTQKLIDLLLKYF
ncbi:MAG: aldehyde dehydrogenase family protein [Rhodothermales bacterium]